MAANIEYAQFAQIISCGVGNQRDTKMAHSKENNDDDNRNDDGYLGTVRPSVSSEYYTRGSAELATESALTLAKIQHVSTLLFSFGYACLFV